MKCWVNHAITSLRNLLHRVGVLLLAFSFFLRNCAIICVRLIFQSILKGVSSEGFVSCLIKLTPFSGPLNTGWLSMACGITRHHHRC